MKDDVMHPLVSAQYGRIGAMALLALVLMALTACGGGEDLDGDGHQGTMPVTCTAHPEQCQ